MPKIQLLPEHIANQIAAGEVVQRPASVVKELLENSIDAGSKNIKLIVKDGGKNLIQVVDDGSGMDETDARMAFERHATSKIRTTEDLFHIRTKGFRGEALASIAAVAHVELFTKPQDADLGTRIRIEGGKVVLQEPAQTAAGTSIAVKNLFFNVPARRKFLKSQQVEMRHIIDEFQRVALAYPEIGFSLIHNGKEVYKLYPENLFKRIGAIFGRKMHERLLPVGEKTDYVTIEGYTGKPEFAKLRRGEQFFFVNRRFIKSSYLHSAVMKAYEGLLPEQKIPPYFLFFEIEPEHIDINIHPTKTEIKFDDEATVYALLRASVRHALGKFDQMPSLDFDRDPSLDFSSLSQQRPKAVEPKIKVSRDFNPFKQSSPARIRADRKAVENYDDFLMPETAHPHTELISAASLPHDSTENPSAQNENSFQWNEKYIVTHTRSGLMIIHPYRAHQTVLFEQFLKQLQSGTVRSQNLMFPWEPDYLPGEVNLLEKYKEILQKSGIVFLREGDKIRFTAMPAGFETHHLRDFLEKLLADLSEGIPFDRQELLNRYLAVQLASASAVRAGTKLDETARQKLIASLFSLENPRYSPEGRKNFIILSENEIDNRFS